MRSCSTLERPSDRALGRSHEGALFEGGATGGSPDSTFVRLTAVCESAHASGDGLNPGRAERPVVRSPAITVHIDKTFIRQVRDALTHLHDLAWLQTHALTSQGATAGTHGRALQRSLLEALAALRPASGRPGNVSAELLRLRYEADLPVDDVARRLAISRSEYYRQHDRGLMAVAALLRESWGPGREPHLNAVTAPAAANATHLPRALTRFIGREREQLEIAALLDAGSPLVTLAGAGGCGKTRLAYEVAAAVADRYPDGLWAVELAAVSDPDLVPLRVAAALGIGDLSALSPTQRLVHYLADRKALLLLDNCEHLLNACATLIDTLLRSCRSLQVLATSREPLATDGETIWRTPSLSLPSEGGTLEEQKRSEAVRLFVDRAAAARRDFALNAVNAPAIAQICCRLDGIPLAIELAAARIGALSPSQVAARLGDRLDLLTRGDSISLPRHRTLRGLVDWSYELLSESERCLFARLSVFPGAFDLRAVEATCDATPLDRDSILDLLSGLVDKSLVVLDDQSHDSRYRLLETLRAYAHERLAESGAVDTTRASHAAYVLDLAETAAPRLRGADQRVWIERLERELPSIYAALDWLCAGGRAATALQLSGALGWFWHLRGYWRAGSTLLSRALALPCDPAEPMRPRALCAAGLLASNLGRGEEARHWLDEALTLFQARGDRTGEADALNVLGLVANGRGEGPAADAYFWRALEISGAIDDHWGVGRARWNLAESAEQRGDLAGARAYLSRVVQDFQACGALAARGIVLGDLARVAHAEGARAEARDYYRESLAVHRAFGIRYRMVPCLRGLAALESEEGAREEAVILLEEALGMARDLGLHDLEPQIARDLELQRGLELHRTPTPLVAGRIESAALPAAV